MRITIDIDPDELAVALRRIDELVLGAMEEDELDPLRRAFADDVRTNPELSAGYGDSQGSAPYVRSRTQAEVDAHAEADVDRQIAESREPTHEEMLAHARWLREHGE